MTHKYIQYTCIPNIPTNHKANMQHIDKDFSWDRYLVKQIHVFFYGCTREKYEHFSAKRGKNL